MRICRAPVRHRGGRLLVEPLNFFIFLSASESLDSLFFFLLFQLFKKRGRTLSSILIFQLKVDPRLTGEGTELQEETG